MLLKKHLSQILKTIALFFHDTFDIVSNNLKKKV